MDNDKDKKLIKSPYYSLEKLSEDSSLVKRGLRDLNVWPKIEELFEKLKELFKAGKIQECINISEEILKTDSNHFFTLCYYGKSLYLAERYEESLKILDRCLEEEKQYYFLWSFYADVFYKLGRYSEAVENYDEALKLELYKIWYIANKKTDNSLEDLIEQARKVNHNVKQPEQLIILDNYLYYLDEDKVLDEIGCFRKAQFYLSTRAGIYNAYKENDIGKKRAIEALKEVLKLNPNNWFAKNLITETLESLASKQTEEGQKQEALNNIDVALIYNPESSHLMARKAILLNVLGDKENAIRWIGRAKEKDPTNEDLDNVYQKINNIGVEQKLYRGTLEQPIVFPESIIVTTENLDSIDFDKIIYCEITPSGAMGNEGGILIYVMKDEDTLTTYEINLEVDVQVFDAVSGRISQNANLFINYYGGMGNYVYVKKNTKLEIDEKNNCFWYHSKNTKLRIDSSVEGVFIRVVAEMTSQDEAQKMIKYPSVLDNY